MNEIPNRQSSTNPESVDDLIVKKRIINHKNKQIETRIQRKIVLEDGVLISDSGPMITTKTIEDSRQELQEEEIGSYFEQKQNCKLNTNHHSNSNNINHNLNANANANDDLKQNLNLNNHKATSSLKTSYIFGENVGGNSSNITGSNSISSRINGNNCGTTTASSASASSPPSLSSTSAYYSTISPFSSRCCTPQHQQTSSTSPATASTASSSITSISTSNLPKYYFGQYDNHHINEVKDSKDKTIDGDAAKDSASSSLKTKTESKQSKDIEEKDCQYEYCLKQFKKNVIN